MDIHWRVIFYVRKKIRDNVWTAWAHVYAGRSYIVSNFFTHVKIYASVEIHHKGHFGMIMGNALTVFFFWTQDQMRIQDN